MKCSEIILCTFFFSVSEMLCNPAEQGYVGHPIKHVGVFSISKHLCFESLLKTV